MSGNSNATESVVNIVFTVRNKEELDQLIGGIEQAGHVTSENINKIRESVVALHNQGVITSEEFDKFQSRLNQLGSDASESVNQVDSVFQKLLDHIPGKAGFAIRAMFGLVDITKQSYEEYSNLSQIISDVLIKMGYTSDEAKDGSEAFNALKDKIYEVGFSFSRFGAEDTANAANRLMELGKAGYSSKDALDALVPALRIAESGNSSLAEVSEKLVSIFQQVKIPTNQLAGSFNIMEMAIKQNHLSLDEMGSALVALDHPLNNTNFTFGQVIGSLSALSENGIRGAQAGQVLSDIWGTLQNPTSELAAKLNSLGVNTRTTSGEMRPLVSILTDLSNAQMTASELSQLFGENMGSALPIISDNINKINELSIGFEKAAGTLKTAGNDGVNSIKSIAQGAASSMSDIRLLLGDTFHHAIDSAVSVYKTAVDSFSNHDLGKVGENANAVIQTVDKGANNLRHTIVDLEGSMDKLTATEKVQQTVSAGFETALSSLGQATEKSSQSYSQLGENIASSSSQFNTNIENVNKASDAHENLVTQQDLATTAVSKSTLATKEWDQSFASLIQGYLHGQKSMTEFASGLEGLSLTSSRVKDSLEQGIGSTLKNLTLKELQDFSAAFQTVFEKNTLVAGSFGMTTSKMIKDIELGKINSEFSKLGLDLGEIRSGFDKTGLSAIGALDAIANSSQMTSRELTLALDKTTEITNTQQELGVVKARIIEWGENGKLSSEQVAQSLALVDAKLKALTSTLDSETSDAFKRMGVQSRSELETLANQAEEDFERIASSGEVTAEGLDAAANKYINATRAAYGDGAAEMARYAAESKGAHVAIENTAQSVEHLGAAGDGASTSMERVAVSTGNAVEKTKEVASDISKADAAASEFEATMGAIAAAIDSVTRANRDWMASLSDKAVNAYVDQLGWGFKTVTQDLKFFRQAEKDALEVIDNIQMDNLLQMYNAVDQVMDRVNITANRVAAEFYHQSASAEVLKEKLADVGNVSHYAADSAESAISGFDLLDDQTLDSLRSQIEAVRQANEALSQSIHGTLSNFQEELLRLQGNQQAVEEKNYQERLSQLDDYYQKAKAIRDNDAMAEVERARKTAEEIHALNLAKIKEDQEGAKNKNQQEDPYQTGKIREATQAQEEYTKAAQEALTIHKNASEEISLCNSKTTESTLFMNNTIAASMHELSQAMQEASTRFVEAVKEMERVLAEE